MSSVLSPVHHPVAPIRTPRGNAACRKSDVRVAGADRAGRDRRRVGHDPDHTGSPAWNRGRRGDGAENRQSGTGPSPAARGYRGPAVTAVRETNARDPESRLGDGIDRKQKTAGENPAVCRPELVPADASALQAKRHLGETAPHT